MDVTRVCEYPTAKAEPRQEDGETGKIWLRTLKTDCVTRRDGINIDISQDASEVHFGGSC